MNLYQLKKPFQDYYMDIGTGDVYSTICPYYKGKLYKLVRKTIKWHRSPVEPPYYKIGKNGNSRNISCKEIFFKKLSTTKYDGDLTEIYDKHGKIMTNTFKYLKFPFSFYVYDSAAKVLYSTTHPHHWSKLYPMKVQSKGNRKWYGIVSNSGSKFAIPLKDIEKHIDHTREYTDEKVFVAAKVKPSAEASTLTSGTSNPVLDAIKRVEDFFKSEKPTDVVVDNAASALNELSKLADLPELATPEIKEIVQPPVVKEPVNYLVQLGEYKYEKFDQYVYDTYENELYSIKQGKFQLLKKANGKDAWAMVSTNNRYSATVRTKEQVLEMVKTGKPYEFVGNIEYMLVQQGNVGQLLVPIIIQCSKNPFELRRKAKELVTQNPRAKYEIWERISVTEVVPEHIIFKDLK